jgi:Alcohol dehydrogenase GroES-like domain
MGTQCYAAARSAWLRDVTGRVSGQAGPGGVARAALTGHARLCYLEPAATQAGRMATDSESGHKTSSLMRAMVLEAPHRKLRLTAMAVPTPGPGQVLLRVAACAVCRTDLHVVDGELTQPKLPLVPGHEIVGRVAALGEGVTRFRIGDRVGVPVCRACPAVWG